VKSEHLKAIHSDRGFARLPQIDGRNLTSAHVYESSAADSPHIWLGVMEPADLNAAAVTAATSGRVPYLGEWKEATIHLTADAAWKLADQLRHMVEHHYQGDARPEWATT
jgi:hypothetical protein